MEPRWEETEEIADAPSFDETAPFEPGKSAAEMTGREFAESVGEGSNYPSDTYTSLGPTLEVMQAPFIVKDAAMLAAKSPSLIKRGVQAATGGVRDAIANYLKKKAADTSFEALGATVKQAKELGPEGQQALGRVALDKNVVGFGRTPENMLQRAEVFADDAGAKIGEFRQLADDAVVGPGTSIPEVPTAGSMKGVLERELGKKYGPGLHAGERGALDDALDELVVRNPQTLDDWAGAATDLNKHATKQASMMQSAEPATDVANIISRENTAAINARLAPADEAAYGMARQEFGQAAKMREMLGREQARGATGGETPFSRSALMNKMLSPQSRATAMDKVADLIKTNPQALGKNSQALMTAAQRGRAALASTMYVLQQQDPEFRQQMRELSEQE